MCNTMISKPLSIYYIIYYILLYIHKVHIAEGAAPATLVGAHRDSLIAATQSLTKKEIGVYVFFLYI